MRFLFTFAGGNGHFEPLVPLARAAQQAGHTIAVAGQHGMVSTIEAAGFTGVATSGATLKASTTRGTLLKVDREREDRVLREVFAGRVARQRAAALAAVCESWRPEVLVCDEIDFGAMVAAERLGLPYATVLVIASGAFVRKEVVAEPLNEVRAAHGLPPDPALRMLSRYLVLSPFPASFRDPAFPLPDVAHSICPVTRHTTPPGPPPPWRRDLDDRPTVYFTLGTIFHLESGDLFERVLVALGALPINLIATVGRELDAARFGPQPPSIRILSYIPQAQVLPHCTAVVSHGGSGSVMGALAYGLPMVLLPLGADQPLNAARCDALGVARRLDAVDATPEMIQDAVVSVLTGPSYRRRAERLREELLALPEPDHALRLLERLAVEKRPLRAG